MEPTEGYAIFANADEWHMSVHKFLTGRDAPLGNFEWKLWQRFRQAQFRIRKQNERKQGKKGRGG